MDTNGTRFHLLLGKDDWGRCTDEQQQQALSQLWSGSTAEQAAAELYWDAERYEVTLQPRLFQFVAAPKDRPPELTDRRGAARDRFGNWYWVSASRTEILVRSAGTQTTTHFWSTCDGVECKRAADIGDFTDRALPPQPPLWPLSGLAVTDAHYLVVGVLEPPRLLVFDLYSGGPPRQLLWPAAVDFTPFDMAPMPGGGVWILDRDLSRPAKPGRYWALDRYFNVIGRDQQETTIADEHSDEFQPIDGTPVRRTARQTFPGGISLDAASPIAATNAIAIEALPDGTVLILDRPDGDAPSLIYHYAFGEQLGAAVSTAVVDEVLESDSQFVLRAHDFAFVPEHEGPDGTVADRLDMAAADGNQTGALRIFQDNQQLQLTALAKYWPMRLFGGKGLVASQMQVYYDFGDGWIPLTEQRRPRFTPQATLLSPVFDGDEPDCVWHRLLLDASIPAETTVEVWSRSANDRGEIAGAAWYREPGLYLRPGGSEQPFARDAIASGTGLPSYMDPAQQQVACRLQGRGTWELLFQRARGRYVQVRLQLTGNERTTPRLRALRAYYPRFSYLGHYLPAVYRDDEQSASFLDRFLANLEGLYTGIEDQIATVQVLFDARSVPADALEWLAAWFGVALDPTWDDAKRRLFIAHAMEFFQYRGTMRGLQIALRLALDACADEAIFSDQPEDVPRRIAPRCYGDCPGLTFVTPGPSKRIHPSAIRIVERYRIRRTPGVVLGDATEPSGLPEIVRAARWSPAKGAADLNTRYREFLQQRYQPAALPLVVPFPIRSPESQSVPEDAPAGTEPVVPATQPGDEQLWQSFLARRYADISALNGAYNSQYAAFADVHVPTALLPQTAMRRDWNAFVFEKAAVWEQFAQATVGFVPSVLAEERQQWQDYLAGAYRDIATLNSAYETDYAGFAEIPLPDGLPADPVCRCDWERFQQFSSTSAAATARTLWQDFLARRYRHIDVLNDAHATNWTTFDVVSLPDELPRSAAPLQDWYQFEAVVMAMQRTAHRFTVLLPVPTDSRLDPAEQQRRLDLAERIVSWEKPAHTTFDVKFYWALFCVGGARLGEDTLLDQGSRAPQLMTQMALNQASLGESYLAPRPPQDASDRQILGRDGLHSR